MGILEDKGFKLSGKNILAEMPYQETPEETRMLVQLEEKYDVLVKASNNDSYGPTIQEMFSEVANEVDELIANWSEYKLNHKSYRTVQGITTDDLEHLDGLMEYFRRKLRTENSSN